MTESAPGELESEVARTLAKMLSRPVDQLRPDADLQAELGLDSVEFFSLVSGLEDEFDIVLPTDDTFIKNVRTIRDLAALIAECRAA